MNLWIHVCTLCNINDSIHDTHTATAIATMAKRDRDLGPRGAKELDARNTVVSNKLVTTSPRHLNRLPFVASLDKSDVGCLPVEVGAGNRHLIAA